MPARLSGSGVGRARCCPPAYALPAVFCESSYATSGTAVHAFLRAVCDGAPPEDALAGVTDPGACAVCAKINPRQVPRGGQTEVAFAYDPVRGTARRIDTTGHREYVVGDHEIPGTMDWVRGSLVVDFKAEQYDFDAEASRPQLECYALMLARADGLDEVTYRIVVVSQEGAFGGPPPVTLGWEELEQVAARVRRAWDAVHAARAARAAHEARNAAPWTPDVTEGTHCKWCPATLACPGKRAAIGATLGADPAALTAATVGAAYARFKDAEKVGERVKEIAKAFAQDGVLPTGDGRVVRLDGRGALVIKRDRRTGP